MVFAAQNHFGVFYLITTFSYFVCRASIRLIILGEVGKLESGAENRLPLPLQPTVSCQHNNEFWDKRNSKKIPKLLSENYGSSSKSSACSRNFRAGPVSTFQAGSQSKHWWLMPWRVLGKVGFCISASGVCSGQAPILYNKSKIEFWQLP